MNRLHAEYRMPILLLIACLALFAGGCGDDDETVVTEPDPEILISGTLSRAHGAGDGSQFQDELEFSLAASAVGDIVALRLAGVVDDAPGAGDPDGLAFHLEPAFDVSLFTPGNVAEVELLNATGTVRTTALFETLGADTAILSPQLDDLVSPDGFSVQWRSDGLGTLVIRLTSAIDDTQWETTVENDGFYEISAGALDDFPKGACELEIVRGTAVLLSSVELGAGAMELSLSGRTVVRLAN